MPKSQNYIQLVRHLDRLISRYNGRRWRYFRDGKPLWEQKHFGQFMRLVLTLSREGIKPEELLQHIPYRQGRFYPAFFNTPELHEAILEFKKHKHRRFSMTENSKQKDMQFLKEMVESTGKNVLYLINFFWNDLHPDTQKAFERFHNEWFLSTDWKEVLFKGAEL